VRILVLADIHANWPALAAIDEPFDACLVLGDLVDYGPAPGPCIEWVREHADYAIRGNHDHGVAQLIPGRGDTGYRHLSRVTRELMWQTLDAGEISYLARLPVTETIQLDGVAVHLVHGTPRDPLDEYLPPDREQWAQRLRSVRADLVCVGHTHLPFVLKIGKQVVLNPGSVGQPRDGDPRAAYAVIDDGQVSLRRVEYPVDETIRQLQAARLPDRAKQFAAETLRTGGRAIGSRFPRDFEPVSTASDEV
jgi:putative phosphoesterase